jgi:hypothetical protein
MGEHGRARPTHGANRVPLSLPLRLSVSIILLRFFVVYLTASPTTR